jgi:predicted N-formylglutamate amidohydrolase
VLDGEARRADVGRLYDPARAGERDLCLRWRNALRRRAPGLTVRRNYPYTGRSDGLTAWLRRRFPAECYLGIELEVNQRFVFGPAGPWRALRLALRQSLADALSAVAGLEAVESCMRATKP